ncbi:MAG: hypothetical protein HY228_00500 [Candidatus Yonathbacteria bacterium]|nr:hypothetical protein [Candidatus Yonathbacteria bacterium]
MYTKNAPSSPKGALQKSPRGGLRNKGNPLAIKQSIAEAIRDVQRTDHDLEKIKKNKEELLADLADLRIREKEAEEDNLSEEARGLIKKNILNIQKRLNEINGIIPEVILSDDQKKIQKIINEWNIAKKEKRSALAVREKSETALAKDPSNMKAMGKANRASAAIYENTQKMERAFYEAQIAKKNFTHDHVLDESVNIHTGEEEAEKLKKEKRNEGLMKKRDPVRDEGISYTHKQAIVDQEKYRKTHRPIQKTPLPEKKKLEEDRAKTSPEKRVAFVKKEAKQDLKKDIPQQIKEYDYAKATKNLLLQMSRVIEKSKGANANTKKKEIIPAFTLKPGKSPLLLNDGDHIPESRYSLRKTLRNLFTSNPHPKQTKESRLASPFARKILLHHLDILFGKKGFLGFGARAGVDSPHWIDPVDGFSKKTVEDILGAHPSETQKNPSSYFGIKNYTATTTMKKYLSQALEQTKISPNSKENTEDYLMRIINTIFSNQKK